MVLCHLLRIHPDAHTIDISHELDVAHAGNALQTRLDIDIEIVSDEGIVIAVVGTLQGNDAQHSLFFLLYLHTYTQYLGWQITFGLLYTVLYSYLCQIRVSAGTESNTNGGCATAGR